MQIREFSQDLEGAVVALWNQTLTADPVSVERFRKQVLWDDNFDPLLALVACEGTEVVGFLLATKRKFPYMERGLEPDKGWVNLMFVRADMQRAQVGSSLLTCAEMRLVSLGVRRCIIAAYSPGYFFRGVDKDAYPSMAPFLEKRGYVAGEESYRMCRDLYGFRLSPETKRASDKARQLGYRVVPYDDARSLELLRFVRDEFGGGWKRNCLMAMRAGTARDRILIVLSPHDTIVGFCTRAIDDNPMRFGPIGIAAACRSTGIGGVLLESAMYEMEKKSIHHMFFLSTDAAGRRFYERHGVKVLRTFTGYQKNLA